MAGRIDASDLPPDLAKKLGVDQAKRKRNRATAPEQGGRYRCAACGAEFDRDTSEAANASDIAAQPHVNEIHGGGRIELVLDQEGGQQ